MYRRLMLSLVTLTLLLSLANCGSDPSGVKLTEKDNAGTVELQVGDEFEITLQGNPPPGYNWEVASVDPAVIQQVGESEFVPDSRATGSSGKVTLHFEAVAAGKTLLQLVYYRPWEEGLDPLETFVVVVVVK